MQGIAKAYWSGLFVFLVSVVLCGGGWAEGFPGAGEGTEDEPYRITDLDGLDWIRNEPGAHYILMDNIDASATSEWNEDLENPDTYFGWEPIGDCAFANAFTGNFDGQGHTIDGLYINRDDRNNVGLFGVVGYDFETFEVGLIKNVNLSAVNIKGADNVGGIAGWLDSATISNVEVEGEIQGEEKVGGVAGYNFYGSIWEAVVDADIEGTKSVGGVAGKHYGVAGLHFSSYGSVSGVDWVGGLVGFNHGYIEDSYSEAEVFGTGYAVGGLVGYNERGGLVADSYAMGNVVAGGANDVGGLAGINDGNIKQSYATGDVNGGIYVGGLAGSNDGSILNSYARGNVNGEKSVGGLVGHNLTVEGLGLYAYIKNCYSTGEVSGDFNFGGLIGTVFNGNTADSFWDTTGGITESAGGEGKTGGEMRTASTFTDAGWDFENIWGIDSTRNDGYPIIIMEWVGRPGAPLNAGGDIEGSSVSISWDSPDTTTVGYNVYINAGTGLSSLSLSRQEASTEIKFSSLATLDSNVTEFTDVNLNQGEKHYYLITALDSEGRESSLSSDVIKIDSQTGASETFYGIAWGIERIKEADDPDPDPDPDDPDDDDDDDEEEPRRRRPAPAPDPDPDPLLPPDVRTPGFDGSNANLSWGDSPTPGITNFNVYASTGGEGLMLGDVSDDTAEDLSWTLIAQLPPDTTEYTHTGLTSGVRYYYVITSQLACGTECAESSEVMWVDTGTGETGKLPPIAWSADRIAPDVDDDSSSRCFIATAAYGSSSAFEVAALRGFRDGFLVSSAPGRLFTDAYYRFSPALAEAVEGNRALGYIIRLHLAPVVDIAGRFLSMN